jgi:hypothetical protein
MYRKYDLKEATALALDNWKRADDATVELVKMFNELSFLGRLFDIRINWAMDEIDSVRDRTIHFYMEFSSMITDGHEHVFLNKEEYFELSGITIEWIMDWVKNK